jgi:UDP-N-acetylglucosamine acyltransferase
MSNQVQIHPSALVDPKAELDSGVVVGPFCIVGPHVKLGRNTVLQSHAVIQGHTTFGESNEIFPFASVGNVPQDLKYKGEPTTLLIGSRNKIRENATLQPGTVQGGGQTVVGDGNLFMAYTHVAHDCMIGNENILANGVQLSGHVTIGNRAVLGGLCGVHQFCRIGNYAMAAAGSMVAQDLPHFCMAQGDRAYLRGLNIVGLRRGGVVASAVAAVKAAYKLIFLSGAPTVDAAIEMCREQGLLEVEVVKSMVEFLRTSQRGVMRPSGEMEASE